MIKKQNPEYSTKVFPSAGLPEPVKEYKFHPKRKWCFDMAWPDLKLALEIEGGIFTTGGGRHNRGAGYKKDIDKYNAAVLLGWRIIRCTPQEYRNLKIVSIIREAIHPSQDPMDVAKLHPVPKKKGW